MKYFHCLAVLFILLPAAFPVHAQNYVGLIGGVNISNITVDADDSDFDSMNRLGLGGIVGFKLNENFTLHLEPMYLQKGAKQNLADPGFGDAEFRFKGDIIELPVFLKLDINAGAIHPYLLAGPTVGFIMNSDLEIEGGGVEFKGDAGEIIKTLDFGLGFGGGLRIPLGRNSFFVEGRYTVGLRNINDGGVVQVSAGNISDTLDIDPDDVKTKGFQIMAGVTFPLGNYVPFVS